MIKFEITLNNQNRFIQKCCMHKELSCFKIETKCSFPLTYDPLAIGEKKASSIMRFFILLILFNRLFNFFDVILYSYILLRLEYSFKKIDETEIFEFFKSSQNIYND